MTPTINDHGRALKPLWEHQKRDIQTCLNTHGVFNASDPGTGKTRTCIEVIRALKIPVLILAPKSILQVAWGNDIEEYAPELTYQVAYASNRAKAFTSDAQIIITNHDAAAWLRANPRVLERFNNGLLIIDESTAMKNPSAQRSKATAFIRPFFSRAICMSGTPTPQGIIDLWHQMFLVDQGARLGTSYYRFRANTYTPVNKGAFTEWKEKPGMSDAVADLVADVTIRNRRDNCMDLPEHQIVRRTFELSDAHMKQYLELKKSAVLELESGDINAVNAAVLLAKLLQVASGAVYDIQGVPHVIATTRYDLVMDLVDERDHSVVVFSWRHQRDQMMRIAESRGYAYGWIDGTASDSQRTQFVEQFQAGKLKCLFIHPASAGHGITLTRGCATIWASPTYNAEHFEQANARIYRGGQTRKTETILISAKNTVDLAAYAALEQKQTAMSNLLELLNT